MDGFGLLRELREDKDLRGVAVIFLFTLERKSRIKLMLAQVISCDLRPHELHSANRNFGCAAALVSVPAAVAQS